MRCALLASLLLITACAEDDPSTPDAGGDGDSDADADADGDGDGDTDADTDVDAGPREERCNGADDDLDGEIDEDDPEGGFICLTRQPGRCANGHTVCVDGVVECPRDEEPRDEACSNYGRDDDCNGVVDDIPGLGEACETGLSGRCAAGTMDCGLVEAVCIPNLSPQPEVCPNEIDDDCNGEVDDGIVLEPETCENQGRDDDCNGLLDDVPGQGVACDTGLFGICQAGAMGCAEGAFGCQPLRLPGPEICPDGADDDCDGEVDEGIVPTAETCDNPRQDNDCNGVVDDVPGLGQPCDTGIPGICAPGIGQCDRVGEVFVCVPEEAASLEICESLADEDCDGEVDELECLSCEVGGALDEVEPNDEIAEAQVVLCVPVVISATQGGCDADVFEFTVADAGTYTFQTSGGCSDFDSTLWLFDADARELDMNDDWDGLCSYLEADLEPGTYYIQELGYDAWQGWGDCSVGDYDLTIEPL